MIEVVWDVVRNKPAPIEMRNEPGFVVLRQVSGRDIIASVSAVLKKSGEAEVSLSAEHGMGNACLLSFIIQERLRQSITPERPGH